MTCSFWASIAFSSSVRPFALNDFGRLAPSPSRSLCSGCRWLLGGFRRLSARISSLICCPANAEVLTDGLLVGEAVELDPIAGEVRIKLVGDVEPLLLDVPALGTGLLDRIDVSPCLDQSLALCVGQVVR